MRYVDFHCHLDNYPDFELLAAAVERERVYTLAVTTTPSSWDISEEVCSRTKYIRAALGLHPHFAESHFSEMRLFESILSKTRYVGEIGIDGGPVAYRSIDLQTQVFNRILSLCSEHEGKILSIHSFRAVRRVLDGLEQNFRFDRGTAVLHWFTGTPSEARRAVEMGCYFSINERMSSSLNGKRILQALPLERILTETDGPFTKAGNAAAKPTDVGRAVRSIGSIIGLDDVAVAGHVLGNLRRFLEINLKT